MFRFIIRDRISTYTVHFAKKVQSSPVPHIGHRRCEDIFDCMNGREQIRPQPLTAPEVMPEMTCSWNIIYPRIEGTIETTIAAYMET